MTMRGRKSWLFAHSSDEPFLIWSKSPVAFAITAEIPLFGNLILAVRQAAEMATRNQHVLAATESAMAIFLSAFLRMPRPSACGRLLLAFSHNVSNVMSGRSYSPRRLIKHYETVCILCATAVII